MRLLGAVLLAGSLSGFAGACGGTATAESGTAEGGPAPTAECNALREEGRVGPDRAIELLRCELHAGERLVVVLECEPPDAVVLELQGPAEAGGAGGPQETIFPDAVVWTEFPRPLPPGTEVCPPDGCEDGGSYWLPPSLDRRVTLDGLYRLRLEASERAAACSVCVTVQSAP